MQQWLRGPRTQPGADRVSKVAQGLSFSEPATREGEDGSRRRRPARDGRCAALYQTLPARDVHTTKKESLPMKRNNPSRPNRAAPGSSPDVEPSAPAGPQVQPGGLQRRSLLQAFAAFGGLFDDADVNGDFPRPRQSAKFA